MLSQSQVSQKITEPNHFRTNHFQHILVHIRPEIGLSDCNRMVSLYPSGYMSNYLGHLKQTSSQARS